MSPRSPHLPLVALGLLTLLPLASFAGHPSRALADPRSELPVKAWCFEKMPSSGLFGGETGEIGYPTLGAHQVVRRVLDQPGVGPRVVYLPGAPP